MTTILVIANLTTSTPGDVWQKLEDDLEETSKTTKGVRRLGERIFQIDLDTALPFLAWLVRHPLLKCSVAAIEGEVVWRQCEPLVPPKRA